MRRRLIPLPMLVLLVSCGEAPQSGQPAAKKEVKPPEAVTGRYALYQMFAPARGWALDAQVLELKSIQLPEVQAARGKAGAWQATFVSPSRGTARTYTYSVIEAPGNLHKGTFAGLEQSYRARGQNSPFLIAAVKTDSGEVFETALKKGADYDKKNAGLPINFILEKTPRFPNPAWRVVWGSSVSRSNFSIYVDASTGNYLQTMR